jgi:hypothetical protein
MMKELDKGRFKKILSETGDIERITTNYLSTDNLFLQKIEMMHEIKEKEKEIKEKMDEHLYQKFKYDDLNEKQVIMIKSH